MIVPTKNVARWARELIDACLVSQIERIQRGAVFKSLYLTGSEDGDTATLNKIYNYIQTTSSFLYSPVDVRFSIKKYGMSSRVDRAKGAAAASVLGQRFRETRIDSDLETVTDWSLVKGKAFLKLVWTRSGFAPQVVQPESMGVLQENLPDLDRQEAFVHRVYITPQQFARRIEGFPEAEKKALARKVTKYFVTANTPDGPNQDNVLKQIILGGLYPYNAGGTSNPNPQRGIVNWLSGPAPTFDPKVLATIIPLDELWVWDDRYGDYCTIQMVGNDCMVYGEHYQRNLLSESTLNWWNRITRQAGDDTHPLANKHPFVEFCPNPLDGYFWGLSDISQIALLQKAITHRMNGINGILRRQEDPPRAFFGSTSINQRAYSIFNKPGGFISESSSAGKVQTLSPELPGDLWESLHEFIQMFDEIGGYPAVMKGKGEAGVRSNKHAQALIQTASPLFKRKALRVERSVEEVGGLAFSIMKAVDGEMHDAWVAKDKAGVEGTDVSATDLLELPPAPGLKHVPFLFYDMAPNMKVTIDSHSASPAFAQETQVMIEQAARLGAVGPDYVLEHMPLPDSEDAEADLIQRQAAAAALAAAQAKAGNVVPHPGGKKR